MQSSGKGNNVLQARINLLEERVNVLEDDIQKLLKRDTYRRRSPRRDYRRERSPSPRKRRFRDDDNSSRISDIADNLKNLKRQSTREPGEVVMPDMCGVHITNIASDLTAENVIEYLNSEFGPIEEGWSVVTDRKGNSFVNIFFKQIRDAQNCIKTRHEGFTARAYKPK